MGTKTLTPSYGIAIVGKHCINCTKYFQYYLCRHEGKLDIHTAVDCGYCEQHSRNTRPGNKCREYEDRENRL